MGGVVAEAGASNPPIYGSIWKRHRSGLSPERTPAAQDAYGMLSVIFNRHERERNQLRGGKKEKYKAEEERKKKERSLMCFPPLVRKDVTVHGNIPDHLPPASP